VSVKAIFLFTDFVNFLRTITLNGTLAILVSNDLLCCCCLQSVKLIKPWTQPRGLHNSTRRSRRVMINYRGDGTGSLEQLVTQYRPRAYRHITVVPMPQAGWAGLILQRMKGRLDGKCVFTGKVAVLGAIPFWYATAENSLFTICLRHSLAIYVTVEKDQVYYS